MKTSIPQRFFPGDLVSVVRTGTVHVIDIRPTLYYIIISCNKESFRMMSTKGGQMTSELRYSSYVDIQNITWEILQRNGSL